MAELKPAVRPVARTFVVEIDGIDLARDRDEDTIGWIEQAVAEHGVVIFRDQKLSAADVGDIGHRLGRIEKHIFEQYRHEDVEEVSYVTNRTREGEIDEYGVRRASLWHIDEPYKLYLAKLTMLHALEVPKVKGGTWYADAQAAYDALPPDMKARADTLVSHFKVPQGFESEHPTVAVHPRTGRRGLFLSPQHQIGFVGMTGEAGLKLMQELIDFATQDDFTYYHQWRVGDVVMWDDVSTFHRNAVDSDPAERRVFLRTIVH